ncbi:MAG TPA: hypothetical protein VF342_07395 [Alphaproteobacteria bacterium]
MAFLVDNANFDQIDGSAEADFIFGLQGQDLLDGHEGPDIIFGGGGDDGLLGGAGSDLLYGGPGDDHLDGGIEVATDFAPDDTADAAPGIDLLTGGPGADHFIFENGSGETVIQDFDRNAGDKIELFYSIDGVPLDDPFEILNRIRLVDDPANFPPAPEPGGGITQSQLPETFVVLDFGNGDRLTVVGIDALAPLNDFLLSVE